jgi:hypothetical protein
MEQPDDDGGDDRHHHQAENEASEVCACHIRIPYSRGLAAIL